MQVKTASKYLDAQPKHTVENLPQPVYPVQIQPKQVKPKDHWSVSIVPIVFAVFAGFVVYEILIPQRSTPTAAPQPVAEQYQRPPPQQIRSAFAAQTVPIEEEQTAVSLDQQKRVVVKGFNLKSGISISAGEMLFMISKTGNRYEVVVEKYGQEVGFSASEDEIKEFSK